MVLISIILFQMMIHIIFLFKFQQIFLKDHDFEIFLTPYLYDLDLSIQFELSNSPIPFIISQSCFAFHFLFLLLFPVPSQECCSITFPSLIPLSVLFPIVFLMLLLAFCFPLIESLIELQLLLHVFWLRISPIVTTFWCYLRFPLNLADLVHAIRLSRYVLQSLYPVTPSVNQVPFPFC